MCLATIPHARAISRFPKKAYKIASGCKYRLGALANNKRQVELTSSQAQVRLPDSSRPFLSHTLDFPGAQEVIYLPCLGLMKASSTTTGTSQWTIVLRISFSGRNSTVLCFQSTTPPLGIFAGDAKASSSQRRNFTSLIRGNNWTTAVLLAHFAICAGKFVRASIGIGYRS